MRCFFCLLLLGVLNPIQAQRKNQRLAELTYNSLMKTVDAATPAKRDAFLKSLNGVLSMAKDRDFEAKLTRHIAYLEGLQYFNIPKADTTRITDNLLTANRLKLSRDKGALFIEPDASFKAVTKKEKSGAYLYLFINTSQELYLEMVNYTNGRPTLGIEEIRMTVGAKDHDYFLNWVKTNDNGFEYCTIETNTENFNRLFEALSASEEEVTITFKGPKKERKVGLSPEMLNEMKTIFACYHHLKQTDGTQN